MASLFEFWNPGVYLPGVLGGICLLLAMIALSMLPVQYGALALLLLGIALMIGEAFTPGIGALGIGGLVHSWSARSSCSSRRAPTSICAVSLPVIFGAAIGSAALSFAVIGAALKARQRPPVTGAEEMLTAGGTVIDWGNGQGHVQVRGEIWAAKAARDFKAGDAVRVRQREGLTLIVDTE